MRILFISLGCDKNLVDTEKMLSLLAASGHTLTDEEDEAEAVVVNTCCFIGDAKAESIDTLLHYAGLKTSGSLKYLLCAGCLAQRYWEEIRRDIPEVDAVIGTSSQGELAEALNRLEAGEEAPIMLLRPLNEKPYAVPERMLSTPGHYAYLKIAEGCDKCCTYCIIPKIRGPYRSIPEEALLKEAEKLADAGVKELILVAQETTLYGVDLYGQKRLPQLLEKLSALDLSWIRLLYCYPEELDDALIRAMAALPKVLPYLDIPIQHAADGILKRMGRKTTQTQLKALIGKLRDTIPGICLRTTLITGFPGETEQDHEECLDFIRALRFDRLGVFTYSREEGTPAARMPEQIHWKRKERWKNELLAAQQEITFAKNKALVGKELDILVEGALSDSPGVYVGRSYRDAPEVDGLVFVSSPRELITGDMVRVRTDSAEGYDLSASLLEVSPPIKFNL